MKSLRIVLVLPDAPLPLSKSAAARAYYVLLKGLVERGHQVATFVVTPNVSAEAVRKVFPAPEFDLRTFPVVRRNGLRAKYQTLRRPYSHSFSPALRRELAAELRNGFDVLHLEQLWTGWLGLEQGPKAFVNVHCLAEIDLAGERPQSLAGRIRLERTRRAERFLLRQYGTFSTVSPRLAGHIRKANPRATVHTVPLGLDLSLYPFDPERELAENPVITLIGSFLWQPTYGAGIRLIARLWPEIKRRIPRARLQVVGLNARSALEDYLDMPDVNVEANVPDILPYFLGADALLYAPEQASGMKVKIQEAFALGVPVITTSEGVEGLPAKDRVHAAISDDDRGLIERTVALLTDRDRWTRQRQAARSLVGACCNPDSALDRIESVYRSLPR